MGLERGLDFDGRSDGCLWQQNSDDVFDPCELALARHWRLPTACLIVYLVQDTEETQEQTSEKVDKRRIKRAPWRTTILEDGTIKYNDKPNDPEYFKKYWSEKRRDVESTVVVCERCQKKCTAGHLTRHLKSNYCIKRYNEQMVKLLN